MKLVGIGLSRFIVMLDIYLPGLARPWLHGVNAKANEIDGSLMSLRGSLNKIKRRRPWPSLVIYRFNCDDPYYYDDDDDDYLFIYIFGKASGHWVCNSPAQQIYRPRWPKFQWKLAAWLIYWQAALTKPMLWGFLFWFLMTHEKFHPSPSRSSRTVRIDDDPNRSDRLARLSTFLFDCFGVLVFWFFGFNQIDGCAFYFSLPATEIRPPPSLPPPPPLLRQLIVYYRTEKCVPILFYYFIIFSFYVHKEHWQFIRQVKRGRRILTFSPCKTTKKSPPLVTIDRSPTLLNGAE